MICPLGYCNNPNCNKKAACTAQSRNYQSRAIQANQAAYQQSKQDNNQEFKGQYRGYNTQTGLHSVQLPDGSVIPVKSISSGAIIPGRVVAGILPHKGSQGIVSAMPH